MQLVVTEKPSVAQAISHVIGAKERKMVTWRETDFSFHGVSDIW